MESEKPLSGEESLRIIQQMINAAQNEIQDKSFHYLLWGWIVLIASLWQFVSIEAALAFPSWLGWIILTPLGGIASSLYGRKEEKERRVKTQYDEFLKYVLQLCCGVDCCKECR